MDELSFIYPIFTIFVYFGTILRQNWFILKYRTKIIVFNHGNFF